MSHPSAVGTLLGRDLLPLVNDEASRAAALGDLLICRWTARPACWRGQTASTPIPSGTRSYLQTETPERFKRVY
jgi:hypothetical protein